MKFVLNSIVFSALLLLPLSGQAADPMRGIVIGTGGPNGVYFPTGVGLCKAVTKTMKNKLPCVAKNSKGSVDNIERLRAGKINFGIVQNDTLFYALKGYGPFKGKGKFPKLRTALSMFTETFTILARKDSGIRTLDDLKGKRVNIGSLGSGQRASMELVMLMKGWTKATFSKVFEFTSSEISGAICDNKVDAIVYVIAHPNPSIKKAAQACETVLVQVYDPTIKKMIEKSPYLQAARIRGGTYPGSPQTTLTFGIKSTLVTTMDMDSKRVKSMIKALYYNFSDLLYSHPALHNLTRDAVMPTDEVVPVHAGAAQYFLE
ncbi:MAG: C4-dicarboxylate ABC transporter substrate-binding protein [Rhodospirillaceae bacterium]|nr:MAG: C4-dicarboxylate ABC transporter substrate-binding protein [Rhodospirillaceae bacterium]